MCLYVVVAVQGLPPRVRLKGAAFYQLQPFDTDLSLLTASEYVDFLRRLLPIETPTDFAACCPAERTRPRSLGAHPRHAVWLCFLVHLRRCLTARFSTQPMS